MADRWTWLGTVAVLAIVAAAIDPVAAQQPQTSAPAPPQTPQPLGAPPAPPRQDQPVAQPAPADPPSAEKPWSLSIAAGLAATTGNKDTATFNFGYDVAYDPQKRNAIRSSALLLRGATEGELTADRLDVTARDEYRIVDGVFLFGQGEYLRDPFKDIDYLVAPTAGLGIFVIDTDRTTLSFDAGAGGLWEKRGSLPLRRSGAVSFSERVSRQISANASFAQSLTTLHKTTAFDDALYTLSVVIGAALTSRTQLKVEGLDTYKSKIPATGFVRNDAAILVSLVYRN